MIRVHGDVRRINLPAMEHKDVHGMVYDIMNDGQRKIYEETLDATFPSKSPTWRVSGSMPSTSTAAPAPCSGPFPEGADAEELNCPKIFRTFRISARHRAGHRPDRFRQVDDAGGDGQSHQRKTNTATS